MNTKRTILFSVGSTVFTTLFLVFGILSIINSMSSVQVMKLGIGSIAPENLKRAPESFMLNLRAESRDFPVEAMTQTKAWSDLQHKVSGYAARLELIERQNRQRSLGTSLLYVVSAIGMALFSWLNSRRILSKSKKRQSRLNATRIEEQGALPPE